MQIILITYLCKHACSCVIHKIPDNYVDCLGLSIAEFSKDEKSMLSPLHILVQGGAHSARTGIQFLDHALDLCAEARFVEVEAEYVGTAVELAQAAVVLPGLAYFKWGNNGLKL